MALHSETMSHLPPIQLEMMEWEINEERECRQHQREHEANMQREDEQYHLNPDGLSFWKAQEVGSSTEPLMKKCKLSKVTALGVPRPTKPLPSQ
ncbi:hypothetical protein V5O48_018887, partial [Marasmius crinis-equi]